MFELILGPMRLRQAARRFARQLPRQLRSDYGASETYTPPQIVRAVNRAGLPTKYICIGLAGFLTEEAFNVLKPRSFGLSYKEIRMLLQRLTPPDQVSAQSWPNSEVTIAQGAAGGWPVG
jgi:hypothetical protein